MKTSVNTAEVSSPAAQTAGWGVKPGGEHAGGPEKRRPGAPNLLANSCEGGITTKTIRKTQFDTVNIKSNGKSRLQSLFISASVALLASGTVAFDPNSFDVSAKRASGNDFRAVALQRSMTDPTVTNHVSCAVVSRIENGKSIWTMAVGLLANPQTGPPGPHGEPSGRGVLKPATTNYSRRIGSYVQFLKEHKQSPVDYIVSLFDHYDLVVLCERPHPEVTQYDLIYEIASDFRFQQQSGQIFTEIGSVALQPYIEAFLNENQLNEGQVNEKLRYVAGHMGNDPFWPESNYYNLLRKIHYLDRSLPRGRRVHVYPVGLNFDWEKASRKGWDDFRSQQLGRRDKIMAENVIQKFNEIRQAKSQNKVLVIMNYRHAFPHLQGAGGEVENTCGYLMAALPGKVANVMINSEAELSGTTDQRGVFTPVQDGRWDAAFAVLRDPALGFDFKSSPFGKDDFDYWPFNTGLRYENVFTGFVFFAPLKDHRLSFGIPGIVDRNFEDEVLRRFQSIGASLSNEEIGLITNLDKLQIFTYGDCPYLSKSDYNEKIQQWLPNSTLPAP